MPGPGMGLWAACEKGANRSTSMSPVLPGVHTKVAAIAGGDRSALDIPDGGFSTAR